MAILKCKKKGVDGWKNGESGICHIGIEAKQRAIRDEKKEKAKKWKEKPRPIKKATKKVSKKTSKK
jgi:hypothetical protein